MPILRAFTYRAFFVLLCLQYSIGAAMATDKPLHGKVFTIGFAQDNMANDWRAAQVRQFVNFFKDYPNIHFIYSDAGGSTAKQIQDVDDFIFSKVDIIITSPRDGRAMTPVIKKAYQQGIPVILVTRTIQSNDYTSYVGPDDYNIGQQAARYFDRILHGKGKILILRGIPTATTAIARTRGFLAEIKNYPGIKIAAIRDANYLRSDAIRATDEVMREGIAFDAIYAQSDSMATGARLALAKAHLNPANIPIVGIDYIKEARHAILNGLQSASFVYPTSATEAGKIALRIINHQHVPKKVSVPSQIITRENAQQISPIF